MKKITVISRRPKRKHQIAEREGNVVYPEALRRAEQQLTPEQLQASKILSEILNSDDPQIA